MTMVNDSKYLKGRGRDPESALTEQRYVTESGALCYQCQCYRWRIWHVFDSRQQDKSVLNVSKQFQYFTYEEILQYSPSCIIPSLAQTFLQFSPQASLYKCRPTQQTGTWYNVYFRFCLVNLSYLDNIRLAQEATTTAPTSPSETSFIPTAQLHGVEMFPYQPPYWP